MAIFMGNYKMLMAMLMGILKGIIVGIFISHVLISWDNYGYIGMAIWLAIFMRILKGDNNGNMVII